MKAHANATLDQLFLDTVHALDDVQAHLEKGRSHTVEETQAAIKNVFKRLDFLMREMHHMPADAAKAYHPPLQQLLTSLEEFQHAMLASKAQIKQELETVNQHKRAFMAYLSTPVPKK